MNIRQIFITIAAVMLTSAVFADTSSVTSKKYVDDFMTGYQNKIPGSGTNKLMIYDNSDDSIGEKQIVSELGSSTSATDVPNVGAVLDKLDEKQETFNGTAGYVMTGTGTAGEVDERAIYGTAVYSNSLVTAETVNTGVTNAVNSSLIRVDANGAPSDTGTLWEINTSLFALSVLPPEYTQLEWIKSTGGRYIDTGVYGNNNISIKTKFKQNALDSDATTRIVISDSWKGALRYMLSITPNTTAFNVIGELTFSRRDFWTSGQTFTVSMDKTGSIINGQSYPWTSGTETSFTTSTPLKIFGVTDDATRYALIDLYYMEIYENGELVRNFIPVSHVENNQTVIGMYDTVQGIFYAGTGTGSFAPGPAVAN